MQGVLQDLIARQASLRPDAIALEYKDQRLSYSQLQLAVEAFAASLCGIGLHKGDRVGVYLPKQTETAIALFGAAAAGAAFVPVNPLLKPEQVAYILRDCNVRVLVTSSQRADQLVDILAECPDLELVVLADEKAPRNKLQPQVRSWQSFHQGEQGSPHRAIDQDLAAILYTSGSTGNPKGVALSHRNIVAGAWSVSTYLENTEQDRILAVLPLSFDYGLSQLTTAFYVGATVVLMEYLLPRDVIRNVEKYAITGLAAVPPLWVQLAQLDWPEGARRLRYITNSGGAMPGATLAALRQHLPRTRPYLMYGLTEAFRSTYLDPAEIDRRPDSMGKAIPGAEILVLREDGSECEPDEAGELVHRGVHVSLGYWNAPEKTALRFKPLPDNRRHPVLPELAVWSGDTVKRDRDGFLYFIGRKDDMIKSSGYRISPSELEDVVYGLEQVAEVAAIGVPSPQLGQAVVLVVKARDGDSFDDTALLAHCKAKLPNFMQPHSIQLRDSLPRNANGKIDRKALASHYQHLFSKQ